MPERPREPADAPASPPDPRPGGRPGRPTRRYESPRREAAARATHLKIVEAAAELFRAQGYVATTMTEIARAAEVSVQRVNLSGTKIELLLLAYRLSQGADLPEGFGRAWQDDADPTTEPEAAAEQHARSIRQHPRMAAMLTLSTEEALAAFPSALRHVHEMSAGLWFALRAAAGHDTAAAELLRLAGETHDADYAAVIAWCVDRGLVTAPEEEWPTLAATLRWIGSPETWRHLVVEQGFSDEAYERWVSRSLVALVLDGLRD